MRQLVLLTETDPTRMQMFRYLYRNITWTALHDNGKRAIGRTPQPAFQAGAPHPREST